MLFVTGFGCWQEASRYLNSKRDVLMATAAAFASASADAVAVRDQRGAYLAIRGIGAVPSIDAASLFDASNRMIANIGSGARLSGDLDITEGNRSSSALALLGTRTVSVTVPVKKGGSAVGRLSLIGEVSDLRGRLLEVLATTVSGAIIALAIGFAISLRLQRHITRPMIALTEAMAAISANHDYATRVVIDSDDEIGLLAESFNGMIGEVRERDTRLIAHRDRLEDEVAGRTQELRLAKDDAEAANAAKSTFLATMSHEIRTPMTGLLVMAELLATGDLPARSRRYAEVICRSGSALLAIINDILDFSKIEAGKMEVERVRLDVRDLADTVVALFHSRAVEKGLDLAVRFAPDVPTAVEGDPVRLQQVIGNLVNNALKFTSEGYVLIDVAFEEGDLVFAVTDTGIGIAEDKVERIFQAFSQADGSTTRQFGGTGLGLSISSRLAVAMGGAITVRSRPQVGSTFTCRVPAAVIETAPRWTSGAAEGTGRARVAVAGTATSLAVASALAKAGFALDRSDGADGAPDVLIIDGSGTCDAYLAADTSVRVVRLLGPGEVAPAGERSVAILRLPFVEADLRRWFESGDDAASDAKLQATSSVPMYPGARVLVADDTAVNREVMIEALSRFGIVPDLAENGREALDAALATGYDLIFMDASMPVLDGFEACRRLRLEEGDRRHTPVLALTAHIVGSAADAWRDAGMDGVLHKPFTMAGLQHALTSFLARAGEAAVADHPTHSGLDQPDSMLLDERVLAEIADVSRGAKHDFARRVFQLFVDHAPRSWEAAAAAAAAHDHEALASAAHAIKSMSLNIGAVMVGGAAATVESDARAGAADPVHMDALQRALTMTRTELSRRLQDLEEVAASGPTDLASHTAPGPAPDAGDGFIAA